MKSKAIPVVKVKHDGDKTYIWAEGNSPVSRIAGEIRDLPNPRQMVRQGS